MVVAQMLEGRMSVDTREAAIHHTDTQPRSVDAVVYEMLSAKALQLRSEYVISAARSRVIIGHHLCDRPAGDDFLDEFNKR